jgi:two-component system KDP operon response regulator KdpE
LALHPSELGSLRPARILLVDDDAPIANALRVCMAAYGYEVRAASNGVVALRVLGKWTPDLVITSIRMRRMDGLEFCRRLRQVSPTPVIVLCTSPDQRASVEALNIGANDYLTRPFSMGHLLDRVLANMKPDHSRPRCEPLTTMLPLA